MPRQQASEWMRWAGLGLTLFSGVAALAVLLLPLMLVLLMVLFDSVAHGVVVLLGLLLDWLRALIVGSEGGPLLQTVAFHPLQVAFESLLHALPCLTGLILILLNQRPGTRWWWIVLSWSIAAGFGGPLVAALLLPGLCIAILFALPLDALHRR